MRLVLGGEQEQLRSTVRKLLNEHSPPERVRAVMNSETGYDRELWQRLTSELGLAGLVAPEEYGGSGAGHVERCVVLEELGRALLPAPYFASAVLALDTVLALGEADYCGELVPELVAGTRIGALAHSGDDGAWGSSASSVYASQADDGWVLDGHASFVVSGADADVVLVYADTSDGPAWFAVSGQATGLSRKSLRTLDPTRGFARVGFEASPARKIACTDPAAVLTRVRDRAAVALAAEQLGGMQRVLELTAEYAKVRVQFGRTIGSYQSVKHACADLYTTCEQASSVVRYAAWVADYQPDELPIAASLAQVYLGPAYFAAAADGVQLHGGLGYTWEHDAHLYYKRAKTSELLFGGAEQERTNLAERLGI